MNPLVRNRRRAYAFLTVLCVVLILIGLAVAGPAGGAVVCGMALVLSFALYRYGDLMILKIVKAREIGPRESRHLYDRVQILARRMGLPTQRVYVMPVPFGTDVPLNVMALGREPLHGKIVATARLVDFLEPEEVDGVIAHELAHIARGDTLLATLVALVAFGLMALIPRESEKSHALSSWARHRLRLVLFFLLAPLAAAMIHRLMPPSRELEADRGGVTILGISRGMMSAFVKMEDAASRAPLEVSEALSHLFIVPPVSEDRSVLRLFRTHPPTEARVEHLTQLELTLHPL